MEPPTKRSRTGISPFNDQEEIDGDELNLQPERVNALRDPGYQLEKSRAFAASKLKSAFERIFEKYERDFEGVADEIDLSTGQIVVDNGHIQSLEIATLNADNDSEDEEAENEVIDEDERILQGKGGDKLLSRMGESQNLTLTAIVRSPGQNNQQHGTERVIGGAPKLSSMIYPPQVQFSSLPTQYGLSGGFDHWVDPAWRAPELPPPRAPALRLGTAKKKLLSGRTRQAVDGNGELDEDDILLGVSTTSMATPNNNGTVKRMKRLVAPGSASGTPGTASKSTPKQKDGRQQKTKGSAGKQKATPKTPKDKDLKKPNSKAGSACKHDIKVTENEATQNDASSCKQVIAVRSKRPKRIVPPQDNRREELDSPKEELYVDYSSPSGKRRPLPKNQTLAVEIIFRKELDIILPKLGLSALSPELEPESCKGPGAGASDQIPVAALEPQNPQRVADPLQSRILEDVVREKKPQPQDPVAQEVFSRIVLDPSYTFSDDDEPALPKARANLLTRKEKRKPREQEVIPHDEDSLSLPEKMTTEEEPQPQKLVAEEGFSRIVLDPSFTFSDDEEPALPKARANRQPAHEENRSSKEQKKLSSDPTNAPVPNQDLDQEVENENEAMVWAVDGEVRLSPTDSRRSAPAPEASPERHKPSTQLDDMELAPADGGRRPATPEPAPETNEPHVEPDSTNNVERTPRGDVSELEATGPNEITEQYSPQLLKRKPRRKRKIPVEFIEETLTLQVTAEEEVRTEPFITAPSKRLKKRKQTPPDEFQEFGGQLEEPAEQPHTEPVVLDDPSLETGPISSPAEEHAIPESPQPEAAEAELAIPESPQLEIPILRTSLLGAEEESVALPDPEDIEVDSPPQATPLPSLPSPELGENMDGPSTSPLPYSSPSKAVKAAVKKPRASLPITPINRKGKQQRPKQQQNHPQVSEPLPASASSSRTANILSLISDDEDEETDELSLTPRPRYYTPQNGGQQRSSLSYSEKAKHTSLTAPLLRMKILSSGNPRTPSSHKLNTTTLIPTSKASKMYFSADRRMSSSAAAGGRSSVKRRRSQMISVIDRRPANPVSPEYVDDSAVQTPGGTKRKCGEDGWRCDRDFCFVCL